MHVGFLDWYLGSELMVIYTYMALHDCGSGPILPLQTEFSFQPAETANTHTDVTITINKI